MFQNIFFRILLSNSSLTYSKYIFSYIIEQEFFNVFKIYSFIYYWKKVPEHVSKYILSYVIEQEFINMFKI
jgi:hypothetical protein